MIRWILTMTMVMGCVDNTKPLDGAPQDTATVDDTAAPSCGDASPVLYRTTANPATNPDYPDDLTIIIYTMYTDEDSALHNLTYRIWMDQTVDGVMNSEDPTWEQFSNLLDSETLLNPTICGVYGGFPVAYGLNLSAYNIPRAVWLEFAMEIEDADGYVSNRVFFTTCSSSTDNVPDCDDPVPTP